MTLEKQLIITRDRLEYIKGENTSIDISLFNMLKEELNSNVFSLKATLTDMLVKAKNLNKKLSYNSFSFIKESSDKCKQNISRILEISVQILQWPNLRSLVHAIIKSTENIGEESKVNSNEWIPDQIYGQEYRLFSVPVQTANKANDFEDRIKTFCTLAESFQKVIIVS